MKDVPNDAPRHEPTNDSPDETAVGRHHQSSADGALAQTPSGGESRKVEIQYIPDAPMNERLAPLVLALVATGLFFNMRDCLVMIDLSAGIASITAKNFAAHCNMYFEFFTNNLDGKKYISLPREVTTLLLESPRRIRECFPRLDRYTRAPFFDSNFDLVTKRGYYATSHVYFDGPDIKPADNTDMLNRTLASFLWATSVDMVNFIGLLITALTIHHWPGEHPLAVFNGNKPRIGKSMLPKVLSLIINGVVARTISYTADDREFEKQIGTRVMDGAEVIVIDNAKRSQKVREIQSVVLERSITDTELNYRLLGTNRSITCSNEVIFGITMNNARLGADLSERALPINLRYDGDIHAYEFEIRDIVAHVTRHREQILAELVGMVLRWKAAGCPIPESPARHTVNHRWATTIDAILRYNAYDGFLTNFDEALHAFDPDYDTMQRVCEAHYDEDAMAPGQWAPLLADNILVDRLTENGKLKKDKAQATLVGKLFAQFVGAKFTVDDGQFTLTVVDSTTSHRSKLYGFERVDVRDDDGSACATELAAVLPDNDEVNITRTADVEDELSVTEATR